MTTNQGANPMPTTAQLIATMNFDLARLQAEDARRRELTRKAINHYAPSKLDDALGQGRN